MNDPAGMCGPVRLAPEVDLLSGPNKVPLLYIGARRSYVRLGETAAQIVRWLDGRALARDEISRRLAERYDVEESTSRRLLNDFLQQLDEAGALAQDDERDAPGRSESRFRSAMRRLARQPRIRLFGWNLDRALFQNPLSAIRSRAGNLTWIVVASVATLAAAAIAYTILTVDQLTCPATVPLSFVAIALVLHTIAHEVSHALVTFYHGVKIRGFGVELLYYVIPVAYIDRSDSYRLADFSSRASIALAGPVFDLCAAGATAVAAYLTASAFSNEVRLLSSQFHLLMVLQIMICFANLNPFLPSDGYHVLEAWFGQLNFRRRAFALLSRRLTSRALPAQLRGLSQRQQIGYLAFAVSSLVYLLVFATAFVYQIAHNAYPTRFWW